MGYIIVGDTEKFKDCLVHICHTSKDEALKLLHRFITAPTEEDKRNIGQCFNLRLESTDGVSCWWDDPFLCN